MAPSEGQQPLGLAPKKRLKSERLFQDCHVTRSAPPDNRPIRAAALRASLSCVVVKSSNNGMMGWHKALPIAQSGLFWRVPYICAAHLTAVRL